MISHGPINVLTGIGEDMCWWHTYLLKSSGNVVHYQMMQGSKKMHPGLLRRLAVELARTSIFDALDGPPHGAP